MNRYGKIEGKISWGPTPKQRIVGNEGLLRAGEAVFLRDEPLIPEAINTQATLDRLRRL